MTRPNLSVAASSPSDPLRPAIEARSDAQPGTRSVRPIDPAQIGYIMRSRRVPHPNATIPGADLAFYIFAFGIGIIGTIMTCLAVAL